MLFYLVSELTSPLNRKSNKSTKTALTVAIPLAAASALLLFSCILYLNRSKFDLKKHLDRSRRAKLASRKGDESKLGNLDSLSLGIIRLATNNFSDENKLGEGGFGAVYKGTLPGGDQIAVKRLSRRSGQGLSEMKNEVVLVAKLNHRNLVKTWGWCIEEDEKLIVYEYLQNTSLDKYIFSPIRRAQLDWPTRYNIIEGIGRGLMYLHREARLKIIHRDLKASNILLDGDMNPKISDFGLAKIFGVDENRRDASRIAGTYGYMAPEYALEGVFSSKSDVFSFGILMLEIVTGRRNTDYQVSETSATLVTYVWRRWSQGQALKVIDHTLGRRFQTHEVMRSIHLALLCIQENPTERPSMDTVMLMLNSYSTVLPTPSSPAFVLHDNRATQSYTNGGNEDRYRGSEEIPGKRKSGDASKSTLSISDMEPR